MKGNPLTVVALTGLLASGCLSHAAKSWLEEPLPQGQSFVWVVRDIYAGDLRVQVGDSVNLVLLRDHCYTDKNGCWPDQDSSVAARWEVLDEDRARVSPLPRGAWRFGPGSAGARLYGISPGKVRLRVRLPQGTIVDTAEVTLEAVPIDTAYTHGDSTPETFCARRETAIENGAAGTEYIGAIGGIQSCPQGPRVLAEQWAAPPTDNAAFSLLTEISRHVLDRRVFEAARAVALDVSAGRQVRLAAMSVLAGHYDPCLGATFQVNSAPGAWPRVLVLLGEYSENVGMRGSEPLPPSVRSDVLAALDATAASGGDDVVREAARRLAAGLRAWSPGRC